MKHPYLLKSEVQTHMVKTLYDTLWGGGGGSQGKEGIETQERGQETVISFSITFLWF
jgi:hypothetical protein